MLRPEIYPPAENFELRTQKGRLVLTCTITSALPNISDASEFMYFNLSVRDVTKSHSIVNDRFGWYKREYMYVYLNYILAVHVHVAAT